MEIENNKEQVPFEHYRELFTKADAAQMAQRTGAKYEDGKFYINLLGTEYVISHPEYEIAITPHPSASLTPSPQGEGLEQASLAMTEEGTIPSGSGKCRQDEHSARSVNGHCPLPVQTFLLRYLLESKKTENAQSYKTFREMNWGELYIKPYTGRVLTRAAFTLGTRLEAFRQAGEKMGGIPLNHGDVGFQFDFLDNYKMQIMVWAGDEEFPPNAQVLYSANFEEGFAPEDRVVAGDILVSAIKANM